MLLHAGLLAMLLHPAENTRLIPPCTGETANLFRKAAIFREGVDKSERRQMLAAKVSAVASSLPGPSGTVDGPPGLKVGKVGGLSVRRKRGMGEAYFMLGTFSLASVELGASDEEARG